MKKSEYLHLCDTCQYHPAECNGKPKFGTGTGNDNVYYCKTFIVEWNH